MVKNLDSLLDEAAAYLSDEAILPCELSEALAKRLADAAMLVRKENRPPTVRTPIQLRPGDRRNFSTLMDAFNNDDICLASSYRKATGEDVALVCAVHRHEETNDVVLTPLAVMIEGNPYEEFADPTA